MRHKEAVFGLGAGYHCAVRHRSFHSRVRRIARRRSAKRTQVGAKCLSSWLCILSAALGLVAASCGGSKEGRLSEIDLLLAQAAIAEERHARVHGRYTRSTDRLQRVGLEIPPDFVVRIPGINNREPSFARSYCIETWLKGQPDSARYFDDINREPLPGRCPDFWISP